MVRVEVADNGPGVPAELRERVLEPFFTTKPVGAGTGLGLSVCHGILAAYGGSIEIGDRPGGGARLVVTLPAARAGVDLAAPPRLADAPGGPGGDILVVDDEPEVVAMLEEVLARDGHRVVTAPDGVAALELLRERRFDAVLCDLRMPRLDGPGLARELAADRPDLAARLVLMTGDALRAAAAVPEALRDRLLEKPLDPDEVRRRVAELMQTANSTPDAMWAALGGPREASYRSRRNGAAARATARHRARYRCRKADVPARRRSGQPPARASRPPSTAGRK